MDIVVYKDIHTYFNSLISVMLGLEYKKYEFVKTLSIVINGIFLAEIKILKLT